jgi:hypothetical protein
MPATSALRALGIAIGLSIVTPAAARADWFLTPFLGVKFGGQTSIVDLDQAAGQTTTTFGVSVSRVGDGIFGAEAEFAYVPGYLSSSLCRRISPAAGCGPTLPSGSG